MGAHKMEAYNAFEYLKNNKYEVLTIHRKYKHKNQTIEEFVQRNCDFQCFERNNASLM